MQQLLCTRITKFVLSLMFVLPASISGMDDSAQQKISRYVDQASCNNINGNDKKLRDLMIQVVDRNWHTTLLTILKEIQKKGLSVKDYVNTRTVVEGQTLLEIACKEGSMQIIKILLKNGANPNIYGNDNNDTPLHIVLQNGFGLETIKRLVEKKASIHCINDQGEGVIFLTIVSVKYEISSRVMQIINYFIGQGVKINLQKKTDKKTPLHCAVQKGAGQLVEELLFLGANPHLKDKKGKVPGYYARSAHMKNIFDLVGIANTYVKENTFNRVWMLLDDDYMRTQFWMSINKRDLFEKMCEQTLGYKASSDVLKKALGTKKEIMSRQDFIDEIFATATSIPKVLRRLLSLDVLPSSNYYLYQKDPKGFHSLLPFYFLAKSKDFEGDIKLLYQ